MNKMMSNINGEHELSSEFKHFLQFFTQAWPTNQLIDQPTDQPADQQYKKILDFAQWACGKSMTIKEVRTKFVNNMSKIM